MHFRGGVIVDSTQYGLMPWWPSALAWLNPTDRKRVYNATRQDTHQLIHIPSGKPLYDEGPPNFYSPDKFGPLDWTNGMTGLDSRFSNLVDEVIQEGFKFLIFMDETWPNSPNIMKLVMAALTDRQLKYCVTLPGYDGVFYGWTPSQIEYWFNIARSLRSEAYLGMEHQPGRIPVGNGPVDWQPGGAMENCDLLIGEFTNLHSDSTWQVLGRCIRPYIRPYDQPAYDDPSPPFYLVDNKRGPRKYCAFETWYPYLWVRVNPNDDAAVQADMNEIISENNYFKSMGVKTLG